MTFYKASGSHNLLFTSAEGAFPNNPVGATAGATAGAITVVQLTHHDLLLPRF